MQLWKRIKAWWKDIEETIRFALALDMRALDDPSWLTGQQPKDETKKMVADAKQRAGLSQ